MEQYKSQMINVRVQQCVGVAALVLGTVAAFAIKDAWFIAIGFGLLFGLGFLRQANGIQKRLEHYAANNYERYTKDHPAQVSPRGVTCFKCNSPKIHTKNLMQGTFTREHHCGQCGTTLYYSPEQNR